jgi:outer membrane biosynthesis protein TonB
MPLLDTRHKKKSFTLTTLLLSVLILLLFYIGLTYLEPPPESGITVNFGTMEFGMGDDQPTEPIRQRLPEPVVEETEAEVPPQEAEQVPAEAVAEDSPEEVVADPVPEEPVLTREEEESIRIKQKEAEERRKADQAAREAQAKAEREAREAREEAARIAREKQEAEARAREAQEAKKRELDAMMGGLNNAQGQAEGSEGDDNRAGDKGDPGGDPYASSYYGAPGSGSGSGGYGLSGRTLAGKEAYKQECNESGRVVVQIEVDRTGKVIKATPGVRGTTNNNPCLLEPARRTALAHRWNADNKAPDRQVGFVVVNFKLGQ